MNDGGPAFPTKVPEGKFPPDEAAEILRRCEGMSLRDYFMAHAPVEPQQWFKARVAAGRKPAMESQEVLRRIRTPSVTDRDIKELTETFAEAKKQRSLVPLHNLLKIHPAWEPAVKVLEEQFSLIVHDEAALYLDWPAAWADEMLKRRVPAGSQKSLPSSI